ncbi:BTAD domain-containing putative transcriptional regulator [Streptomyces sp. NPDC093252]|uniref:AfsR/SARP family transcriptional regulator n=1 Tax=Streptomyces sp. NPDC093252 TaxID=3154980 RepID=UPI0034435527
MLVHGEAVTLGPPKQQALLATLLLRPGLTTSTEQLISALWGIEHPAYAKNLVQKYVSGLRSALAASTEKLPGTAPEILWNAGGYRLETGDSLVDLHEYERLASAGTTLALTGSLHRAAQCLDGARILVTGALAEGLDAPVLERERIYRDERFRADMELRAEVELDLGRHRNAVPYLYFVLHRYPLSERFSWLLMLALFRADRGADALAYYLDYQRQVAAELGTDPGLALQELHQRILAQDPELMTLATVPRPDVAPQGSNPSDQHRK